jgi:outer membrane protein OmpA-like peptidoglycan-associated protein
MLIRYLGLTIALLGSSLLIVAALGAIGKAELPADKASGNPSGMETAEASNRLRGIEQSVDDLHTTLQSKVGQIETSVSQTQQDLQALREIVDAGQQQIPDPNFDTPSGDELSRIETQLKGLKSRLVAQDGKLSDLGASVAEHSKWAREKLVRLADTMPQIGPLEDQLEKVAGKVDAVSEGLEELKQHQPRPIEDSDPDPKFDAPSGDELSRIETQLKGLKSRLVAQDGKLSDLGTSAAEHSKWAREKLVRLADTMPQIGPLEDQLEKVAGKVDAVSEGLEELKQHQPLPIKDSAPASTDCEIKSEPIIIRFGVDSISLAPDTNGQLDTLAQILSRCEEVVLTVEGHTDATGSGSYNLALASRRIAAVTNYLGNFGVSHNRLIPVVAGEYDPATTNATLEGREINRRVVLTMMRFRRQ